MNAIKITIGNVSYNLQALNNYSDDDGYDYGDDSQPPSKYQRDARYKAQREKAQARLKQMQQDKANLAKTQQKLKDLNQKLKKAEEDEKDENEREKIRNKRIRTMRRQRRKERIIQKKQQQEKRLKELIDAQNDQRESDEQKELQEGNKTDQETRQLLGLDPESLKSQKKLQRKQLTELVHELRCEAYCFGKAEHFMLMNLNKKRVKDFLVSQEPEFVIRPCRRKRDFSISERFYGNESLISDLERYKHELCHPTNSISCQESPS